MSKIRLKNISKRKFIIKGGEINPNEIVSVDKEVADKLMRYKDSFENLSDTSGDKVIQESEAKIEEVTEEVSEKSEAKSTKKKSK